VDELSNHPPFIEIFTIIPGRNFSFGTTFELQMVETYDYQQ
jgi:hypothetical protein